MTSSSKTVKAPEGIFGTIVQSMVLQGSFTPISGPFGLLAAKIKMNLKIKIVGSSQRNPCQACQAPQFGSVGLYGNEVFC